MNIAEDIRTRRLDGPSVGAAADRPSPPTQHADSGQEPETPPPQASGHKSRIYIYVEESPINVLGLMEVFACAQCVQINFKQVQFFLDVDGAFKCSHGAVSEEAQAEIARSFFITHFDFSAEVGTLCTYKQEVERLSAELTDTLSKNSELESALHDNAERLHALQNQIGEMCAKNRNLTSQLNSRLEENRKFIDLKTELEQLKVKFSDLNVNFNSEVVQHCATKDKEIDCLKAEIEKRSIDMD